MQKHLGLCHFIFTDVTNMKQLFKIPDNILHSEIYFDINITTPVFFISVRMVYLFFILLLLTICTLDEGRIYLGLFPLIQSDNLCLLIEVFTIFNVIIDIVSFDIVLLFIFY